MATKAWTAPKINFARDMDIMSSVVGRFRSKGIMVSVPCSFSEFQGRAEAGEVGEWIAGNKVEATCAHGVARWVMHRASPADNG